MTIARYLVVDYEASADILIKHLIERDGASVDVARDHTEAVTYLERGGFARVYIAPEASLGGKASRSIPKPTIFLMGLESVMDREDRDEVIDAFHRRTQRYHESPRPRDL